MYLPMFLCTVQPDLGEYGTDRVPVHSLLYLGEDGTDRVPVHSLLYLGEDGK